MKQDVSTQLLSFWRVRISLGAIVGGLDSMKTAQIHKQIFNLDKTPIHKHIHEHSTRHTQKEAKSHFHYTTTTYTISGGPTFSTTVLPTTAQSYLTKYQKTSCQEWRQRHPLDNLNDQTGKAVTVSVTSLNFCYTVILMINLNLLNCVLFTLSMFRSLQIKGFLCMTTYSFFNY